MPTVTDRPRRRLGLDLTPLRTSRDYRLVFAGGAVSGFGSFITYVTMLIWPLRMLAQGWPDENTRTLQPRGN